MRSNEAVYGTTARTGLVITSDENADSTEGQQESASKKESFVVSEGAKEYELSDLEDSQW